MKKILRLPLILAMLISLLLCNFASATTISSADKAPIISVASLKDTDVEFLIKKGLMKKFTFNSKKLKLYTNLTRKDTYSVYLNKLSFSLGNYCKQKKIKSVDVLLLDSDINYTYDLWASPNVSISSQNVYDAECNLNYDWKGVIYIRIIDNKNRVFINKSNGLIIDNTCPIIEGVKNENTYTKSITVTVSDKFSGIKDVMIIKRLTNGWKSKNLNIENYQNGICFDSNGEYEIVVTDNSGNISKCSFTVNIN